jgi:hypothetical protein
MKASAFLTGYFARRALTIAPIATVLSLSACRTASMAEHWRGPASDAGATAVQSVAPYPRARWRLAPTEDLGRVVLWVSYISIRHEHSDRTIPSAPGWQVQPPPPARSRQEALRLATSIAERAAAAPERFGDLARECSEDVVTASNGGSLGGIAASALFMDPQFLDALAYLRPGEVSRVIETRHGFNIIRRGLVPAPATIAAKGIVIPYDPPVPSGLPGSPVGRTRAEGFEAAKLVASDLRADPGRFDRLLAEYPAPSGSDRSGSFGVWTNLEVGGLGREREQLVAAAVGDVVGPIDSPGGFEVLVRTPIPPDWSEIGTQLVRLPFRDGAPQKDPTSRESAIALAQSLLRSIDADKFDALLQEYCCKDVERLSRGRVADAFFDVAEKLKIGEISPVPAESPPYVLLVKRVELGPRMPVSFDLPAPSTVDVSKLAMTSSGTAVQSMIKILGKEASSSLGLNDATAHQVVASHEALSRAFAAEESNETRTKALELFSHEMQEALTKQQYEKYHTMSANFVIKQRMSMW